MNDNRPVTRRFSRRSALKAAAGVSVGASALSTAIAQASSGNPGFFINRNQDAGELTIYAWYQAWLEEIIPVFEEETGIKVTNLGAYSANGEWWARLNAGEAFDFFIPTTEWFQRAMRSDMLHEIDVDSIPNIANLFADFQDNATYKNDEGDTTFAVPFSRLLNVLTYNTNTFSEAPTSWTATWDEEFAGKVTMQDSSYIRIAQTAMMLGDDPHNPSGWDEIRDKLMEQKELVSKYWVDYQNGMEMFINEEVLVGELSDGRARMGASLGGAIGWTVPEEGSLAMIDALAIPKSAKNPENAHKFIDFILRPEITAQQMTLLNYDTVNQAAFSELDPDIVDQYASPEDAHLVIWEDLDPSVRERMDDMWTEILLS